MVRRKNTRPLRIVAEVTEDEGVPEQAEENHAGDDHPATPTGQGINTGGEREEEGTPDEEGDADGEGEEEEGEEEPTARRPRKKLRRPTISDTISAIPGAAFRRIVRRMAQDCKSDLRWERDALDALQTDAEAFLIQRFHKAKETLDLFGGKTLRKQALRA